MNHIDFWGLIDITRLKSNGDGYMQADLLIEALVLLSEDDIIMFGKIFQEYMNQAYSWDLWAAAYIINCGCSDDGFMDFRAWLIGQGLATFEKALHNPESLIEIVTPDMVTQIQELMDVPYSAYLTKKGEEISVTPNEVSKPMGEQWNERQLSQKYPVLYAQFGNCSGRIGGLGDRNKTSL